MTQKEYIKVLFVDDDTNLLDGYKRNLRSAFSIETAASGEEGLKKIKTSGPFAVVVSDYKMPIMNGVDFLSRVREQSPDTVRIMLTGFADAETAIRAVNDSNIFRLITKPAPKETVIKTLNDAIEQYNLINAEKVLLSKTLSSSIKVMTDLLSIVRPRAMSKSIRIRRLARDVSKLLGIQNTWQIEISATLSQIGCVTIPDDVLEKIYLNENLEADEKLMFQNHPKVGSSMIANIPRLENVAKTILYQEKYFNGKGFPFDSVSGESIPQGSRILKPILDFDVLMSTGINVEAVLENMGRRVGAYDEEVFEALKAVVSKKKQYLLKSLPITELKEEMVLAEEIRTASGALVGGKGQEISKSLIITLSNHLSNNQIKEPIKVVEIAN